MYREEELFLIALQRKDITAFTKLYNDNRDWLYVVAFSIVEDQFIAEDLVQEMFIMLWESNAFATVKFSIKGFLTKCIYNSALLYIRTEDRNKQRMHTFIKLLPTTQQPIQLDNDLRAEELTKSLKTAFEEVKSLSPAAAEVFYEICLNEKSHKETAELLQIHPKTVMNHLWKAVKVVRLHMKDWRRATW